MATRELPAQPDLNHLRGQARSLQRAVRAGDRAALARLLPHQDPQQFPLHAAQLVIAREYGFASWARLRRYLDVVAEHGWVVVGPEDVGEGPDAFCRLACLSYSGADGPDRWARARALLAARPALLDGNGWAAAAAGRADLLAPLLSADPGLARRRGGPFGWRPLCYLAYSRLDSLPHSVDVARLLLDAGADPNEGYLWNALPMPFTVLTGIFGNGEQGPVRQPRHPQEQALARLVLDAGADPNDGQTLYNRMFATDDSHLELLFHYGLGRGDGGPWQARLGGQLPKPRELLRSLLRWAVEHDQVDRVALLARGGVDLAGPLDAAGHDAVGLARLAGNTRMAALLLDNGAPAAPLDPVDELIAAAFRGDAAAVSATPPEVVAAARRQRPGLLVWATAHSGPSTVELLLRLGFDVNALGRADQPLEQPWETALHHAAANGLVELTRLLLAAGADPTIRDRRFDATPLDWARHFAQEATADLIATWP